MFTSHVISDGILAVAGFFVFFTYLRKLNFSETLLWESFVLSVAVAAVFGAIGFTGFTEYAWVGVFFQNVATIVGVIGLVAGSWYLVNSQTPSQNTAFLIIALGILLLILKLTLKIATISTVTSVGGILAIALIAIYGFIKGKTQVGIWLLAAVVLAACANSKDLLFANKQMATDAYHYLLAGSLFCFGIATTKKY